MSQNNNIITDYRLNTTIINCSVDNNIAVNINNKKRLVEGGA